MFIRMGIRSVIIPAIVSFLIFSVPFHACQKEESMLDQEEGNVLAFQLKSGAITTSEIDAVIEKIKDYVISGDITPGIANSLIVKLENAKRSLDRGNEKALMNQLNAVTNQLNNLVTNGAIDESIGEELIRDVNEIPNECTCGQPFTDTRDGKVYKTVKIGDQCWMAENLAYLPSVSSWADGSYISPYYYVYGYEGTDVDAAKAHPNYAIYGVLYNWYAAMDGAPSSSLVPSQVKGVCPDGWHLPSKDEWAILENYLIDNGYGFGGDGPDVAKSVAYTQYWDPSTISGTPGNDQASNNSSGFSGLPSGRRSYPGFFYRGSYTYWWSATESQTPYGNTVWSCGLGYVVDILRVLDTSPSGDGYSVRCVKD